jgi:hypothetical protein
MRAVEDERWTSTRRSGGRKRGTCLALGDAAPGTYVK